MTILHILPQNIDSLVVEFVDTGMCLHSLCQASQFLSFNLSWFGFSWFGHELCGWLAFQLMLFLHLYI